MRLFSYNRHELVRCTLERVTSCGIFAFHTACVKSVAVILLCVYVAPRLNAQELSPVKFFFYEDTSAQETFQRISEPQFEKNFQPLKTNSIWHEPTESAIWVRFKMPNTLPTQRFLELNRPNFGEVIYYQPSSAEGIKKYETGTNRVFNTRPIPVDRFVFPISNSDEWHYIKIRAYHSINVEFYVKTLEEVIDDASIRSLFYTLYVGFMLAVIAGILFYVYLIRYFGYLFYVGYIIFVNLVSLMEKGYYFQVLWPDTPALNNYFPLVPFFLSLFLLLFLREIWIRHRLVSVLYQTCLWGFTLIPLLIALFLFGKGQLTSASVVTQIFSLLTGISIIAASILSYLKGEKSLRLPLKLISTGLCVVCTSGFIFVATINHVLPTNFFTENAIIIGSVIEVGFLTTAIVIRSDEIYKKQKMRFYHQDFER